MVLVVPLAIICYVIVNVVLGLRKHELYHSSAWDLGVFSQVFDSTIHGNGFFTYTLEPFTNPSGSFFGVHFSPILLAIFPFYAVYPSISTLLVIQAVALGLGALPVYYLSLSIIGKVRSSVAVSLAYLLYFPMQAANLFDFHMESFVVAPMLFAIYYLHTRQWKKLAVSIILVLSTIEYAAFLIAAMGFAYLILNMSRVQEALRSRRFTDSKLVLPPLLFLVAVGWFFVAQQAMKFFNPAPPTSFEGAQNWSILGASNIVQIPMYALLHPVNSFHAIMYDLPIKILYIVYLLAPLFFVPVLKPKALVVAIPWGAFAFLSNYPPYYQVGFQYPLLVIPGIFWALVLSLKRLESFNLAGRRAIISRYIPRIIVASSLVSLSVFASFTYPIVLSGPVQHDQRLDQIIGLVPPGSTVLTQNNLFPHFSETSKVYAIPIYLQSWSTSYQAMVDLTFSKRPDFILIDGTSDSHSASVASQWLRENGGYGVYASSDGVILLKRSFLGTPVFYEPIRWRWDQSNLTLRGGDIVRDSGDAGGAILYRAGDLSKSGFSVAPANPLVLPPGTYNLTLNLKTAVAFTGSIMQVTLRVANGTENLSNFQAVGVPEGNSWTSFVFRFRLQHPESVLINASNTTASIDVYFDFIQIVQLASYRETTTLQM